MKTKIFTTILLICFIAIRFANAQIKVYTGGNACVGSTSVTPNKPLYIAKSGGIRISQTANADSTNELVFQDNGQIRSGTDYNHRIIFDRANNILELREYGSLYFSPGATTGARTQKVTFTSAGDINLNGATNAYQINGYSMLWNNNNASDIYVGKWAGNTTMTGHYNSLMGYASGIAITTGYNNSMYGYTTGNATTTGHDCVFAGYQAALANTTGYNDIAIGSGALAANTTAYHNTAIGASALNKNTTGVANVATGNLALYNNTTANNNTATGMYSLYTNTTGANNAAIGYGSLYSNTTGTSNIAIGYNAGYTNTTGGGNTFVGTGADANAGTYGNCAAIGQGTIVTASNKIFLGNTAITNIQGQVAFATYSDGRFKTNVTANVKGLEFINKLRPVTYKMDTKALDDFIIQNMPDSIKTLHQQSLDFTASKAIVHSGFIAQEVEQAAQQTGFISSIVNSPANANDPYSLSYSEIVVPLVKAVQELSHNLDSLETKTAKVDSTIAATNGEANPSTAAQLQAMQDKINQLETTINACCAKNTTKSMQTTSSSNAEFISNAKDVDIKLYQNKPNPFNNQTTIEYYIPTSSKESAILIFDMQGKLLKTITLEQKENGSIKIDAGSMYPGMYLYTLVVDNKEIDTKRMILTK
jgi:hypothetical protein